MPERANNHITCLSSSLLHQMSAAPGMQKVSDGRCRQVYMVDQMFPVLQPMPHQNTHACKACLLELHTSACTSHSHKHTWYSAAKARRVQSAYHVFGEIIVVDEEGSGLVVDGGHGSVEVHTAIRGNLAHIHLHIHSERVVFS